MSKKVTTTEVKEVQVIKPTSTTNRIEISTVTNGKFWNKETISIADLVRFQNSEVQRLKLSKDAEKKIKFNFCDNWVTLDEIKQGVKNQLIAKLPENLFKLGYQQKDIFNKNIPLSDEDLIVIELRNAILKHVNKLGFKISTFDVGNDNLFSEITAQIYKTHSDMFVNHYDNELLLIERGLNND